MAGAFAEVRWFETDGCEGVLLLLMLCFCVGFLQAYKHVHFRETISAVHGQKCYICSIEGRQVVSTPRASNLTGLTREGILSDSF
jgi:hypothetical protein